MPREHADACANSSGVVSLHVSRYFGEIFYDFAAQDIMGGSIPMLATAFRLAFVTAALALITSSVDAETIHPRCAKFKDKVKCHCWVANGAEIKPSFGGKGVRVSAISEESMEQIIACMRRMGRPNG